MIYVTGFAPAIWNRLRGKSIGTKGGVVALKIGNDIGPQSVTLRQKKRK
jgi:hypothetical protein